MKDNKTALDSRFRTCYKPSGRHCETNLSIHEARKRANLYVWEIAEAMGISENTLFRRLRHELPADEQNAILEIIESLKSPKEKI